VATETDAEGVIVSARREHPEVALIDVRVPGALDAIHAMRDSFPDIRVLAAAVPEFERDLFLYIEAGAHGCLPVVAGLDDLVISLRRVARGEFAHSRGDMGKIVRHFVLRSPSEPGRRKLTPLTRREIEIGRLLEQGRANQEIANALGMKLGTAKNHLHHLYVKLQVRSRGEAVARLRLSYRTPADRTDYLDLSI
jgi:DNA-binding NarL/FixJ family response regulator